MGLPPITYDRPPLLGCPKNMYNGPCGGGSGGSCEAAAIPCVWVEAYSENPKSEIFTRVILDRRFKIRDHTPRAGGARSRLAEKLRRGVLVLTYEYAAGMRMSPGKVREDLRILSGPYDALNFIDSPLGLPHIDPLALAGEAARLGVESVLQLSCKGRSRAQIVSTLLAAWFLGVRNVLAVTGDWPTLGDKYSPPVFDLDAVRLIYLARLLTDLKRDYAGRRVGEAVEYHVGTAVNPYFQPLELEVKRTLKKIAAGAEYLVSQPIFHPEILRRFLRALREEGAEAPLTPSIIALPDPGSASKLEEFARVKVSEDYLEALRRGREQLIRHLTGLAQEIASIEGVRGIHVLTLGDHKLGLTLGEDLRSLIL